MSNLAYATYRAGEVAEITGVAPMMQRDWRHRGLIPKSGEGWVRFDPFEVSAFLATKTIVAFGIPISRAYAAGCAAAAQIVFFAGQRMGGSAARFVMTRVGRCEPLFIWDGMVPVRAVSSLEVFDEGKIGAAAFILNTELLAAMLVERTVEYPIIRKV